MPAIDEGVLIRQVRTMQIIAAALLLGIFTFLAVVLILPPQERPEGAQSMLALLAAVLLLANVSLAVFLPSVISRNALRQNRTTDSTNPTERGVGAYQTGWLVGQALLEGAAFFGLVAFLVERDPLALVVAGVAAALMAVQFPTQSGVRHWLEKQMDSSAR